MSHHAEERYGLELEVLEEDKLSCRLTKIRHRGPALADHEALLQKAERFVNTVTYLEDQLRLVEQDTVQEAVLLRSEAPQTEAEGVDYYEVRLVSSGETEIGYRHYDRAETDTTDSDLILSHRQLERLGQDLGRIS